MANAKPKSWRDVLPIHPAQPSAPADAGDAVPPFLRRAPAGGAA
jgi:hypothetical protein